MNTEITDNGNKKAAGWFCYDAECGLCRRWTARLRGLLERNGFDVLPLQSERVRTALQLPEARLLEEMRVITRGGAVFGGADAVLYLARKIRWGWPLFAFGCLPGARRLLGVLYRWVARNRQCDSNVCDTKPLRTRALWPGWLPLPLMTLAAVICGRHLPAWAYMWVVTVALFGGCKWLTFWMAMAKGARPGLVRAAGFLFFWPGMDAKTFLTTSPVAERPKMREWVSVFGRIILGSVIVWMLARRIHGVPLLTGWVAMIGLISLMHFGLLHLCALVWRRAGVNALPLMQAPARSVSLGEFWGVRWNTGFHQLAHDFLFRPVRRALGVRAATMLVFLVSGLIHELVISLPAGGGWGLPTAYFLAQGAGVLFERTGIGRRAGVGRGWRGWLFTMIVTAGPVVWLFHPPFVSNVMLPFLKTLGAI